MPDNKNSESKPFSKDPVKSSAASFLKTDGGRTKSSAIEIPSVTLPKGGGAIKGMDEKFSVNAVNGTAGFSIPLPFAGARGCSPSLTLSYNSGNGNSIFGLGWHTGLGSIKRKTDKGIPQYLDGIESDTFLFSEAEDLVPEFKKDPGGSFATAVNGDYIINERISPDGHFTIRNYRPRVEGLFARIERWRSIDLKEIRWRVITKDNHTTLYGWTSASRIADPADQARIFEWLPEFMMDDKGNCAQYFYKKEDEKGFDTQLLHNRNRFSNASITYTNVYLEKIMYGNRTVYTKLGDPFPLPADYLFETILDYGEYDLKAPYAKIRDWDFRNDPFSDYKAGFEIRTTRLCRRVLLFHHFTGVGEYDGLVSSLNFDYDTAAQQGFTFLRAVSSSGYIKKADGSYSAKSLPSLEFTYQTHAWSGLVQAVDPENLIDAPAGPEGPGYQFTDLYGEGLSGILTEQAAGWYYKHNLGDGKFEKAKVISPKPSFTGLGNRLQLADLDGDGTKQLVSMQSEPKGYFELGDDNEWQPFRTFEQLPNIITGDSNSRLVDLNGDGKQEILISEDEAFTWYPSLGRTGYGAARKAVKSFDEEAGPNIIFADEKQTVFLANMSGGGMTDIVRIRNGEVCYWPNLGYGRFGAKITMDHSPVFDHPDLFNPSYLRLSDIDGSGTTDIIYLGKNKFSCWMNLGGNSFTTVPFEIEAFPEISDVSKITIADLLGNGVPCIVWSSSLGKNAASPVQYIDLMSSKKPHVMNFYRNNMGKEVSIEYTASTRFYIEDKLAGKPWATKLHFPVHCISRTETRDRISGHRFVNAYTYHHGYYDHAEKEFRGFGMVEQTDSEHFEHWVKTAATNITDGELHEEPVITKHWFHTGAFLAGEDILDQFEKDYWYNHIASAVAEEKLPDTRIIAAPGIGTSLVNNLNGQERREACRACKGQLIRAEVFAKDAARNGNTAAAKNKELTPYTVSSHNCVVELIQPKGKNKFAVFIVKESEVATYSYERELDDPRIAHKMNIKMDELGNVLEDVSIVYPRKIIDSTLPAATKDCQAATYITYAAHRFTNDVNQLDSYRLRVPSETRTYQLKGLQDPDGLYQISDFENILDDTRSDEVAYQELDKPPAAGRAQRRLVEHIRTDYYKNDLTGPLALHQLESLGLEYETYQLAYTPELLEDIFAAKVSSAANREALMTEGKFTHSEGDMNWWIRSGTIQYLQGAETAAVAHTRFYAPVSYTDPYQAKTVVQYYGNYFLFVEKLTDALGNTSSVTSFNFRTAAARRMQDINGNFSEILSDELGNVKATAVFGKGAEADDLSGLNEFTDAAEAGLISDFFATPDTTDGVTDAVELTATGKKLLGHASTRFVYNAEAYLETGQPAVVASIVREEHFAKDPAAPVQLAFEYTNGLGKVAMKKTQAAPGPAKKVTVLAGNTITVSEIDTSTGVEKQLRWIGNGKVILNNKGNPVKQYEPYFSVTHRFEDFKELVENGVTPVLYYDAVSRPVKTMMPDGSFSRVEYDSWKQVSFDANDTVLDAGNEWYINRHNRLIDAQLTAEGKDPVKEKAAADKAAKHAGTPGSMHLDTLGRPVLSVACNRNINTDADELYRTAIKLDIEGNSRQVTDDRGNVVMQYKYDILGNLVYHNSMDSGQRWLMTNILGNPLRTWDERGHEFQFFYDSAHRPLQTKVKGGDGAVPLDNIYDRNIYGESLLLPGRSNEAALQALNILGKPVQTYDTGGMVDTPAYNFKDQPVSTTRKLFKDYKAVANWTDANLLSDIETDELLNPLAFTFTTEIDALGRISRQTAPDGSIITPTYNETGLQDSETVEHTTPATTNVYIKNISYNEKGQRTKIIYGNDVSTRFHYDKLTFRLNRLETKRKNNDLLQDWNYTFDAVGNITHIEDRVNPDTFYKNQLVSNTSEYTHDALYRLVAASGKENDAALSFGDCDNWNDAAFLKRHAVGDAIIARNYTQKYKYDSVGNITQMKHISIGGNWTRDYVYESTSNRLQSTSVGDIASPAGYTSYKHHAKHGFLIELPHLEDIGWNFKDQVVSTYRQHCTADSIPVITYYQYDGKGQRIRKITENAGDDATPASRKEERIYVSGYETYKTYEANNVNFERGCLSLIDQGNRFVMVETVTKNTGGIGTPAGEPVGTSLIRYQLHNHLGSAALELDDTSQVISYEEYHPFGTTAYQAVNKNIKASAKRYRFTGMERDEETGLEYHQARYYITWLGRWCSPDPIGLADGVNIYAYCSGNPVQFKDSQGTQSQSPPAQLHLIEQFTIQTRATRSSFSQEANILRYGRNLALMFGENPDHYQAGHHPSTPQWSTPTGGVQWLGPQHYLANLQQSVGEAADRRAATQIPGAFYRTARVDTGPRVPNPPPTVLSPEVRAVINWRPPAATPAAPAITLPAASAPGPRVSAGPAQLSFPFMEQESPQLSLDFSRRSLPASSAPTPAPSTPMVQLSLDFSRRPAPAPAASRPAPRPAAPPPSAGGSGGPGIGSNIGRTVIPGAAEAMATTEALVPLAARAGMPRLMAAAMSGARSPGPGLVGGLVGAPVGVLAEDAARRHGVGEAGSTGIGLGSALATGAAVAGGVAVVGALIVSAPVTVPLVAGAAIVGGLTAGFGYLMSRAMR